MKYKKLKTLLFTTNKVLDHYNNCLYLLYLLNFFISLTTALGNALSPLHVGAKILKNLRKVVTNSKKIKKELLKILKYDKYTSLNRDMSQKIIIFAPANLIHR